MIQINNLSKQFAGQVLFEDLNFNLHSGERVGLVGRNGSGKSTLFKIILGQLSSDTGEVVIPKNYRISHLEQHIKFSKETVLEECIQYLPAEFQYEYFRAEKILSGLGFTPEDFHKNPKDFSGGYQIRINLCKALLVDPNLLLLDEPTNYLDIISLRWLKNFLNKFPGEVIIITHDRSFMDSVTNHTMGIYRYSLKKIKGSTHKYYEQLKIDEEIYEKTRLNQERKVADLEGFIERFGAKASKAKQAQSKMKQLEKIDVLDKLDSAANMGLKFQFNPSPAKVLLTAKDLAFYFKKDQMLFENLSFDINKNDRIGIIGKNGKGKSTLLNVIAGEYKAIKGTIQTHNQLKIGHFGQTNVSRLHDGHTITQEIQNENLDLSHTQVRNICGSLMFEGDSALKKISVLSGGEKNRVLLGKIMALKTNLLLLDEPTNHLDMESIDVLTQEIHDYEGALLLVTHSESMLRKLVNKLIIFTSRGAELFIGSYDDFLEKVGWEEEAGESIVKKPNFSKKEIHAKRQEIIKERSKLCSPLKKEIEKFEAQIELAEEDMEHANRDLEVAVGANDQNKVLELSQVVGSCQIKIQNAFESLGELEEKLLQLESKFEAQLEALG